MKKTIFTLLLVGTTFGCMATEAEKSPYISKVYDYMPAPGQFVNELPEYIEGDTKDDIIKKVEEQICGDKNPGMISLGGYGGYVVFGFDHRIANVENQNDFKIYGNAFLAAGSTSGGSCEPGIVMVSADENGNGLPDDTWYELAGSDYSKETTKKNYRITYYKPDADKEADPDPNYAYITDRTYIRYTTNYDDEAEGFVMKNSFHAQSYWPEWYEGETIEFEGTKLADNNIDQKGDGSYYVLNYLEWGYADNQPNDTDEGFDIDWAVDADGNNVRLNAIDFVKVYTAVNQYCGWIGETSTEVCGAEDLHPDAEITSVESLAIATPTIKVVRGNSGNIIIRNNGETTTACIYSVSGGLKSTITLAQGDNMIDTNGMTDGVYIIRTDKAVIKFVK